MSTTAVSCAVEIALCVEDQTAIGILTTLAGNVEIVQNFLSPARALFGHDETWESPIASICRYISEHCCPGKNRTVAVIYCSCRAYSDCGRERFESDLGEKAHFGAIFAKARQ